MAQLQSREPEQLIAEICGPLKMPHRGAGLWQIFLDLNSTRPYTDATARTFQYQELAALLSLSAKTLAPYQVRVLRALDRHAVKLLNSKPPETPD